MNDVDFPVARVLEGIDAAAEAGLAPIKINMVVAARRQRPHDRRHGAPLQGHRPHRPVHRVHGRGRDQRLADGRRRARRPRSSGGSTASSPLEPIDPNYYGEVAERWRYRDGAGEIGVISSVTQAFCRTCTRARLSTDGMLYTCLFAQRRLRSAHAASRRLAPTATSTTRSRASGARAATATRSSARPRRRRTRKIEMSYIGG